MKANAVRAALGMLVLLTCAPPCIHSGTDRETESRPREVNMTLVRRALRSGAYCLDGSLPAYHLDRGFGAGARNWLLQFEGGGWCNNVASCRARAATRHGSTRHMDRAENFTGILSNNFSLNPDFYNWNRVKLRYCDGASFAGDATYQDGESLLYFRGQRIWKAIILDLLPKGLAQAKKALLSGCSAGGLSTFLHCDNFSSYLPKNATVKCLSDAGFFLDARDVSQNHTMRYIFKGVVSLQGVLKNLNENCTNSPYRELCFFPQYALPYIRTPFFILNAAYDVFQFRHIFVPPAADPDRNWSRCKLDPMECDRDQIKAIQGFRNYMLESLHPFLNSTRGGMFINSCFAHCQSELQQTWHAPDSPRVNNKTIAEAVGDWYFGRRVCKEIDCAYPCNRSCYNQLS